jgi:TolB-like protein/Tfp pilus assembly protein PilF
MSGVTNAVFLSYASEDSAAAARIAEALRAAGIEIWFDKSELRGGDAWDRQIRDQIHACRLFIAVISANTERRDEGYFRREWALAADRTRDMAHRRAFLLPVVIDATLERGASVPEKFHELQWTRLPGGETPLSFVERVHRLVSPESSSAGVGATPVVPGSTVAESARTSESPFWRSKPAFRAVSIALAVLLTYIVADKVWFSRHAAATGTGAAPSAAAADKSIAVLPFIDMSEKRDQEYFADGMAEEILNLLVKVPDLKVIGRSSSFQFKGKTEDLRQIGKALGTSYVVEGSVRRSGDHLRVTAQLIDARDGTHRWSETYDREASDTLKVQYDIAASLVRALQLEVTGSRFLQGRIMPSNSAAYDAYLRGLHAFNRFDEQGLNTAATDYRRSLQLDPSFLPAAEQLARTLCDQPTWGLVPPRVGYEQARVAAREALKLDPNSAIGHAVLGCVANWYDWDWSTAAREMQVALRLDPYDPFVLVEAASQRNAVGRWLDAIRLCDSGLAADPLLATLYEASSWAHLRLGQFAEAEAGMRRVLEISPTFVTAHRQLGLVLIMAGKPQEALLEMQKETPLGGRSFGLVLAYKALNRTHDGDAELSLLEAQRATDMAMWIAEAYAFRGEKDRAFEWLERAYAQKDTWLWSIKGDPLLKSIEDDPRYNAFLRKMRLLE